MNVFLYIFGENCCDCEEIVRLSNIHKIIKPIIKRKWGVVWFVLFIFVNILQRRAHIKSNGPWQNKESRFAHAINNIIVEASISYFIIPYTRFISSIARFTVYLLETLLKRIQLWLTFVRLVRPDKSKDFNYYFYPIFIYLFMSSIDHLLCRILLLMKPNYYYI